MQNLALIVPLTILTYGLFNSIFSCQQTVKNEIEIEIDNRR